MRGKELAGRKERTTDATILTWSGGEDLVRRLIGWLAGGEDEERRRKRVLWTVLSKWGSETEEGKRLTWTAGRLRCKMQRRKALEWWEEWAWDKRERRLREESTRRIQEAQWETSDEEGKTGGGAVGVGEGGGCAVKADGRLQLRNQRRCGNRHQRSKSRANSALTDEAADEGGEKKEIWRGGRRRGGGQWRGRQQRGQLRVECTETDGGRCWEVKGREEVGKVSLWDVCSDARIEWGFLQAMLVKD